jgi:hypothetical protein
MATPPGERIPAVNVFKPHKNERCKEMAKAALASVLVLLLACSARAGWMQNETPAPPPSAVETSAAQEPTNTAQEPTGCEVSNDLSAGLTGIALDLLAVLRSLV